MADECSQSNPGNVGAAVTQLVLKMEGQGHGERAFQGITQQS